MNQHQGGREIDGSVHRAPVLVADDLRKSYGTRPALRGLSFSLAAGRILGFLGPNGAGKTTAIRILTTILEPDSGSFTVAGMTSANTKAIRAQIGVLPESLGFPKHTTALDYLVFFARMYGAAPEVARGQAKALLEEVGLAERAGSLVSGYSRGMRQRLGIARSLINDPRVVFLDEPTLGLDPRGQRELLALIGSIAVERDVGVILCSHALAEIEEVCDDVVILSEGRVVAAGTVSDVIGGGRPVSTRLRFRRIQVPVEAVDAALATLDRRPEVAFAAPAGSRAGWIQVELAEPSPDGDDAIHHASNTLLGELLAAGITVLSFQPEGGRLEEVFLHLTEGNRP